LVLRYIPCTSVVSLCDEKNPFDEVKADGVLTADGKFTTDGVFTADGKLTVGRGFQTTAHLVLNGVFHPFQLVVQIVASH